MNCSAACGSSPWRMMCGISGRWRSIRGGRIAASGKPCFPPRSNGRARGGKRVRITVVNVRDALIAWYIRRGYDKTGETEPFPYGDDRFGHPLRDDLGFVVLEKALTG